MLDYRHRMMNLPAPYNDPNPDSTQSTHQTLRDQYRAFLLSVCNQAGFAPENQNQNSDQNHNHYPAEGELLREVLEEYIFERAFQAESPDEEEETDNDRCPEQCGPFCRDTPATGAERTGTTDGEENRTPLPQNGYPAITSPDNPGQNTFGQEPA